MRKSMVILCAMLFVFSFTCTANATLITVSGTDDRVLYDDINSQYWIKQISLVGTYNQQINAILGFNSGTTLISDNWGDWRMAILGDVTDMWSSYSSAELDAAFVNNTSGVNSDGTFRRGWMGRIDEVINGTINPSHYYAYLYYDPTKANDFVFGAEPTLRDSPYFQWLPYQAPSAWFNEDIAKGDNIGAWVTATATAPIPEPATILLIGTGLIGLVAYRRKKFKK